MRCDALRCAAWDKADEDAEDARLWGDNWDDDEVGDDDFSKQLRAELSKGAKSAGPPAHRHPTQRVLHFCC
jgi:hypothetical protein